MMPSERRLHPLSFLFDLSGQLQQFLVPGLLVLVGAGSAGWDWQAWLMVLLIPSAIVAVVRSLSFRYRFDASELVIKSGFIFRNERHVPYARIQNIDAVQNVVHRLLGLVEVRIETGSGAEAEARMRVLPVPALEEMRANVLSGRQSAASSVTPSDVTPSDVTPSDGALPERRTLLRLNPRELLLAGFVDSRGLVIVGAAFGLLWEFGLFDSAIDMVFGEKASGRGMIRQFVRGLIGGGMPPPGRLALGVAAFGALVLVMRVMSMGWSLIRLYGFTLDRTADDLRTEFGLFTRVMATIPLHRIQMLTTREGPLHRLFKTASVRVDTAGGNGAEGGATTRESLAPIIRVSHLPQVIREVLPDIDITDVQWRPIDPRGFRRELKGSLIVAAAMSAPFVLMLKWWTLVLLSMLAVWAYVNARLYVRHVGWALTDRAVLFRTGWISRTVSVARFTKIQAVTMNESPFDRRWRMARVRVDTAGAGNASHRVDIPYLGHDTARRLHERLSGEAACTAFRW